MVFSCLVHDVSYCVMFAASVSDLLYIEALAVSTKTRGTKNPKFQGDYITQAQQLRNSINASREF
jgi:hypothetical protein